MTKDEVLKLALEALQSCNGVPHWPALQSTISAIKEAIAAPVQESVATTYKEVADAMNTLWGGTLKQVQVAEEMANRKLYTTPPAAQRQWVGLTDDEIEKLWLKSSRNWLFGRDIEAKLKEKNS